MNLYILSMIRKIDRQFSDLEKILPNTASADRLRLAFRNYFFDVLSLHSHDGNENRKKFDRTNIHLLHGKYKQLVEDTDLVKKELSKLESHFLLNDIRSRNEKDGTRVRIRSTRNVNLQQFLKKLQSFISAVNDYHGKVAGYYADVMMNASLDEKYDIEHFEEYANRKIQKKIEEWLQKKKSKIENLEFPCLSVVGSQIGKSGPKVNLGFPESEISAFNPNGVELNSDEGESNGNVVQDVLKKSNSPRSDNQINQNIIRQNPRSFHEPNDPYTYSSLIAFKISKRIPINFNHKYPNQVKRIPINFNNPINRNIAQGYRSGALQSRLRYRPPFQGEYSPREANVPRIKFKCYQSPLNCENQCNNQKFFL